MSNESYLVTYVGDGVVNLGKAGTFGKGTSAYVSEEVAQDLGKDKNWQVQAPGGHAPRAAAPAPAPAPAPKAAEKHEPAKAEKKAEEKKPAEKPKDEKKAEEPKKAEATAE